MMIAFLVACVSAMHGQNSKVSWGTFDMGYAASMVSNSMTRSVVGQGFLGATKTGNSMVTGGFLADTLFRSFVVSVGEEENLPTVFDLSQNYPNPFNPSTTIQYSLPVQSHVVLKVYNVIGQEVATLMDKTQEAGFKSVVVNAGNWASGVYFYRILAGEYSGIRKMILLR